MFRTACFTVVCVTVCLAAGVAAGIAAGQHGGYNPALPRNAHPSGGGAPFVGGGVALLVGMLLRIAYVLHESRRNPDKRYSTGMKAGYRHGLTAEQYIRLIAAYMLLPAGMCLMGLLLRHQYA